MEDELVMMSDPIKILPCASFLKEGDFVVDPHGCDQWYSDTTNNVREVTRVM